jgi:hypothetical protein
MTVLEMKRALRVWASARHQHVDFKMNSIKGQHFREALRKFKLMEMGRDSAAIDLATITKLKKWLPPKPQRMYTIGQAYDAVTHGGYRPASAIRYIDLHDMEFRNVYTAAEALGRLSESYSYGASPHYGVDNDSIQQYLADRLVGYHNTNANYYTLGIEQAGAASNSERAWKTTYKPTLERTAWLIAIKSKKYHIPIEYRTAGYLQRYKWNGKGITTHLQFTRAFNPGDHTDPGSNYPIGFVIARAREIRGWL